MFVDASALVAIVARESKYERIAVTLSDARIVLVSPISLYESTTSLMRIGRSSLEVVTELVERFLEESRAETVAVDAHIGGLALEAFARYGRGRHKAKLNFGDCFAYACAKAHRVPLLFKGNDFVHTDIEIA
jgi:ribonuclease VapC